VSDDSKRKFEYDIDEQYIQPSVPETLKLQRKWERTARRAREKRADILTLYFKESTVKVNELYTEMWVRIAKKAVDEHGPAIDFVIPPLFEPWSDLLNKLIDLQSAASKSGVKSIPIILSVPNKREKHENNSLARKEGDNIL
jgi:hypothetical protein